MSKQYSWQILNGFYLKIIAFILMTFDHIGVFMEMYGNAPEVAYAFRIIGRLAFPLFIFMMVEGVRHTKNYGKYALRLGIVAVAVLISEVVIHYCFMEMNAYSPLLDLLACSCVIYLLKRKDKWTWFVILPLAYIGLSFTADVLENINNITIHWLPFYLRAGYSIFGLLLSIAFYYSNHLARLFLNSSDSTKAFTDSAMERNVINILSTFFLFVVSFAVYLLSFVNGCDLYYGGIIMWGILSGAFFMLYNGTRGYNKKWFQYGSYLYFPLHIVILFVIFMLINR